MLGKESNYREIYKAVANTLGSSLEAREILSFISGIPPASLVAQGERNISSEEKQKIEGLCLRRLQGEPLQYLLGEWDFYGLTLQVGKGVLIPRSDTERLVEYALACMQNMHKPEVLDLCSGSGAVAIAMAQQRPDALLTGLELSPEAFAYFEKNNRRYGGKVRAIQGDVLRYEHPTPLDCIVSNPPYIPTADLAALQTEVGHEPVMALDGGEDGLYFYHEIARRYYSQLKTGGYLLFEIGYQQGPAVEKIMGDMGFKNITTKQDFAGHDRVVQGEK